MKSAYTIRETLEQVPFGLTRLYQAINAGDLPAKKYGKRTIILHNDLMNFLENLPEYDANLQKGQVK